MRRQAKHFPSAITLACAAALSALALQALPACTGGEVVDLGRNYEAGAVTTDGPVQVQPGSEGGFFGVAIASKATGAICQGSCVDLLAIVTGGTGPFSYAWGEGLGEGPGPKTVCPTMTTTYAVLVSSLSSPQQSPASAVVTVESCDAGVGTQLPHDASTMQAPDTGTTQTGSSSLCITDPSFEGTPTIGTPGTPPGTNATAAPPGWQVCKGDPDIDPSVSVLLANDGMTYLGLSVGSGSLSYLTEAIGTTLCAPLQAGVRYSFCMDLAIGVRGVNLGVNPLMMPSGGPTPVLDVFGGTTGCGQDEPLFISQAITSVDSWSKVCGSFVPSRTLSTLTLVPSLGSSSATSPPGASYVIVDHITSP
jgi:hypothetical protein